MVSEQQEHPEGAVAAQEPAQPAAESQAPVAEPTEAAQEPQPVEATTPEPEATEAPAAAEDGAEPGPAGRGRGARRARGPRAHHPASPPTPSAPRSSASPRSRSCRSSRSGCRRSPSASRCRGPSCAPPSPPRATELEIAELKELFRGFPEKLREEVTENVRGFQKGARRPVSQHAAKQLARAAHTARRMKKNSHPSGEVAEALGQAMAAEMIASLEPEKAAQVILPKRDLLERENRQAQRRQRDEQDKRRDEQRRAKREDARSSRQQTSFGEFSGAKIKGLDELAALFPVRGRAGRRRPRPRSSTRSRSPLQSQKRPSRLQRRPSSLRLRSRARVAPEAPADEATETGSAPQPDDDGDAAA